VLEASAGGGQVCGGDTWMVASVALVPEITVMHYPLAPGFELDTNGSALGTHAPCEWSIPSMLETIVSTRIEEKSFEVLNIGPSGA